MITKIPFYNTYEGWQEFGYHVVKGEKSTKKNKDGNALFHKGQVADNINFDDYDDYLDELDFRGE